MASLNSLVTALSALSVVEAGKSEKLYALYKQATQGDVSGEQPGGFDFVRRAKFDAWREMRGTSITDAMQQYVDLVASLKG